MNHEFLLPTVQSSLLDHGLAARAIACDPELADTYAFCEHYGYALEQSANAILIVGKSDPRRYALCVLKPTTKLDVNKTVCELMGVRKASFASGDQTIELTGMQIGGVTAVGVPTDLPIYVDSRVMELDEVVMGGGNRSSKLVLDPQELLKLPHLEVVDGLALPKPAV